MNNWLKINQSLIRSKLLQLLFKQHCLMCVASTNNGYSLCKACLDSLPLTPNPACQQCGLGSQGTICGNCLKHPPYYDATTALFSYTFPTDAILQHYKYSNAIYLSKTFGHLLADEVLDDDIDMIIPMPLHPARLKERGFNQSLEIAKIIAEQLNLPLDSKSCRKIKNTPPQASLPLKERIKSIKGAFEMNPESSYNQINGKHIAIIDDVMTTGASLNELAKTIKKSGAAKVSCYVLARTEHLI
jgi:ComF family protein